MKNQTAVTISVTVLLIGIALATVVPVAVADESTAQTNESAVDADDLVPADDVNIVSPSLGDPAKPAEFDRGGIIPIELELVGGNVVTVSVEHSSVSVHATVADTAYDPETENGTTVTAVLDTYQVGHGLVESETTGNLEPNAPPGTDGEWTDRRHGFSATGSAVVLSNTTTAEANDVFATAMDIYGGSQDGDLIAPGDYKVNALGGFEPYINSTQSRDDINLFSVTEELAASFDLQEFQPGSATLVEGDPFDVTVTVVNPRSGSGTRNITLSISGEEGPVLEETREVALDGTEETTVTFESIDSATIGPGNYSYEVDSTDDSVSETLTIQSEAEFELTSFSPGAAVVANGGEFSLEATVTNVGDLDGSTEVELELGGNSVGESLTLEGGETETVTLSVDTVGIEPGEYTFTVSAGTDLQSDELTIEAAGDDGEDDGGGDDGGDDDGGGDDGGDDGGGDNGGDDGGGDNGGDDAVETGTDSEDDGDGSGPGFGIVVAALAVLGAALLAMRRQVE